MFNAESLKMRWVRRPCKIHEGIISQLLLPSETYNPFDYYNKLDQPSLYLQFAGLDPEDHESILQFVSNFGLLGLYHSPSRQEKSKRELEEEKQKLLNAPPLDKDSEIGNALEILTSDIGINLMKLTYGVYSNPEKKAEFQPQIDELTNKRFQAEMVIEKYAKALIDTRESVEEIKEEIIRLKLILSLIDAISKKDADKDILIDRTLQLTTFLGIPHDKMNSLLSKHKDNMELLRYMAFDHLSSEVSRHLNGISPQLGYDYFKGEFTAEWVSPNLLSAMYCMLYMDLVSNKMVRKCRNETCSRSFVVTSSDDRKIYCDDSCARAQAQREYRKRVKAKKEQSREEV